MTIKLIRIAESVRAWLTT